MTETAEDRYRATADAGKLATPRTTDSAAIEPLVLQPGDWPGFRGAQRDGRLHGVKIASARRSGARGYGTGQVLLLADQKVLLVLSETGFVALVEASPEQHREIARFQALEGKTWNHPVVAHGKLFVRNSEEAACYQLMEIGASK